MKPSSLFTTVCATLVAIGTTCGLPASEPASKQPYPKPTPPPPPSPVYTPSKERALTAQEIEQAAREHDAMLGGAIERALASQDAQQREAVFTFLLPELLQFDPQRVVKMLAKLEPGEARDVLRHEMALQWTARDSEAAVNWIKSLESDRERQDTARIAVSAIAASDPAQAIHVADQLGVGRDDGSLEQLAQMWAEENPEAAGRWIAAQPDGAGTEQIRALIQKVLASRGESANN